MGKINSTNNFENNLGEIPKIFTTIGIIISIISIATFIFAYNILFNYL